MHKISLIICSNCVPYITYELRMVAALKSTNPILNAEVEFVKDLLKGEINFVLSTSSSYHTHASPHFRNYLKAWRLIT